MADLEKWRVKLSHLMCIDLVQMTKYMVAVDGSEHSNKAYAIAAKLLTNKDEVIFVTVGQKGKGAAAQDLLETWTKKAEADGVRPLDPACTR